MVLPYGVYQFTGLSKLFQSDLWLKIYPSNSAQDKRWHIGHSEYNDFLIKPLNEEK